MPIYEIRLEGDHSVEQFKATELEVTSSMAVLWDGRRSNRNSEQIYAVPHERLIDIKKVD